MSKIWGFFLVAQDMVLSHRAKFQLIINFFRVSMYFVVFLPDLPCMEESEHVTVIPRKKKN